MIYGGKIGGHNLAGRTHLLIITLIFNKIFNIIYICKIKKRKSHSRSIGGTVASKTTSPKGYTGSNPVYGDYGVWFSLARTLTLGVRKIAGSNPVTPMLWCFFTLNHIGYIFGDMMHNGSYPSGDGAILIKWLRCVRLTGFRFNLELNLLKKHKVSSVMVPTVEPYNRRVQHGNGFNIL